MMPARDDCPNGWHEEYHGYLMTAHWDHQNPSNFVCVDSDPESVPGSFGSHDGALLYLVKVIVVFSHRVRLITKGESSHAQSAQNNYW